MLSADLSRVFYDDTVDEWISVNVDHMINKLGSLNNVATKQAELGGRAKNPTTSSTSLPESMET